MVLTGLGFVTLHQVLTQLYSVFSPQVLWHYSEAWILLYQARIVFFFHTIKFLFINLFGHFWHDGRPELGQVGCRTSELLLSLRLGYQVIEFFWRYTIEEKHPRLDKRIAKFEQKFGRGALDPCEIDHRTFCDGVRIIALNFSDASLEEIDGHLAEGALIGVDYGDPLLNLAWDQQVPLDVTCDEVVMSAQGRLVNKAFFNVINEQLHVED